MESSYRCRKQPNVFKQTKSRRVDYPGGLFYCQSCSAEVIPLKCFDSSANTASVSIETFFKRFSDGACPLLSSRRAIISFQSSRSVNYPGLKSRACDCSEVETSRLIETPSFNPRTRDAFSGRVTSGIIDWTPAERRPAPPAPRVLAFFLALTRPSLLIGRHSIGTRISHIRRCGRAYPGFPSIHARTPGIPGLNTPGLHRSLSVLSELLCTST